MTMASRASRYQQRLHGSSCISALLAREKTLGAFEMTVSLDAPCRF